MLKTTDIVHILIKDHVKAGDYCVDATCGNGNDTLFLASLVGENGQIDAYDIQSDAINNAKELTKDFNNINYYLKSHEFIEIKNCKAVLFNLGYLPKKDKIITTLASTTLNAVKNLINQYDKNPEMIIYIVIYPGHAEGHLESDALSEYGKTLDSLKYQVTTIKPINQNNAPYIMMINQKHK